MALCFAHATAGYLVYEAVRPSERHRPALLAASVLLANAPDLDFVPGWLLGHPGMFHRGLTHTLGAVVAVAVLGGLLWRRGELATARITALWAAAAYGSHLLVDYLTTCARPPHGGRFLWPLSDAYWIAPVTPLGEILIDPSSRTAFIRSVVGPETHGVWLGEIALLMLVVAAVRLLRARATGDLRAGEVVEGG
jgi:membrane-bound metal-dependent hydrolase YbcI (DUF457 family)